MYRDLRQIRIKNEQQREQYSANKGKISREWHVLLHCGAAPASTGTRAQFCFGKVSTVLQRFSVERSTTRKFADTHQRRPARSTGPPRFIGVPTAPTPGVATARATGRGRSTTPALTLQPAG
jgi:hypothetical protein